MKTPRFNVFNQIHKALRALMFETALIMQQTDFTDPENAAPILEQTDMLLDIMDNHAHHEDTHILSAAEKHAPEIIAEFEKEHETDLQLTEQLRARLAAYRAATSNEERYELGFDILYALNDFIAFNLTHMNKEETLLNQVLWANYTDAEIILMEIAIQQQIAPDKVFIYFKWMVKGINNTELVQWLKIVKNEAPDFVFSGLLQICQQNLAAERWSLISGQIAEGEMVL
jgi:hypothetical protein